MICGRGAVFPDLLGVLAICGSPSGISRAGRLRRLLLAARLARLDLLANQHRESLLACADEDRVSALFSDLLPSHSSAGSVRQ